MTVQVLDRSSPIPLYLQLEQLWRSQFAGGQLKPGDMFPPEHEICKQYGVSPITVKQAMKSLVGDGVLVRERGRGTFVARSRVASPDLTRLSSPAEDMEAAGLVVTAQTVRREKLVASEDLAELLGLVDREPLFYLERVYTVDWEVLAVEQIHLPAALCPGFLEYELGAASIYTVLEERYGLFPVKAEQHMEAITAEDAEARLFRLSEGSPLLRAERITSLADGRTVEYSRLLYRGDRYKFRVSQSRPRA